MGINLTNDSLAFNALQSQYERLNACYEDALQCNQRLFEDFRVYIEENSILKDENHKLHGNLSFFTLALEKAKAENEDLLKTISSLKEEINARSDREKTLLTQSCTVSSNFSAAKEENLNLERLRELDRKAMDKAAAEIEKLNSLLRLSKNGEASMRQIAENAQNDLRTLFTLTKMALEKECEKNGGS